MPELTEFRQEKDHLFAHDPHSPLTPEQRQHFQGLVYYPENPDLQLELSPEDPESDEIVQMITSTGDVAAYRRWGTITFSVDGQKARLTIFQDIHQGLLFLPFVDATAGDETYSAGRYVEPHALGNSNVLVDFNYAYNPFCAYNEMWSCPIPPVENRISVPLRAGEKDFPSSSH